MVDFPIYLDYQATTPLDPPRGGCNEPVLDGSSSVIPIPRTISMDGMPLNQSNVLEARWRNS